MPGKSRAGPQQGRRARTDSAAAAAGLRGGGACAATPRRHRRGRTLRALAGRAASCGWQDARCASTSTGGPGGPRLAERATSTSSTAPSWLELALPYSNPGWASQCVQDAAQPWAMAQRLQADPDSEPACCSTPTSCPRAIRGYILVSLLALAELTLAELALEETKYARLICNTLWPGSSLDPSRDRA